MTSICFSLFFFNDTATTEIYTLSLHDALPISRNSVATPPAALLAPLLASRRPGTSAAAAPPSPLRRPAPLDPRDRKSTRLNSSHSQISYAVFCLKKNKIFHHRTLHLHDYVSSY